MLDASFVFNGSGPPIPQYVTNELVEFRRAFSADLHYTGYEAMVTKRKVDLVRQVGEIIDRCVKDEQVRLLDGDTFIGKTFFLSLSFAGGSRALSISEEVPEATVNFYISGALQVIMRLEAALRETFEPKTRQPRLYWELVVGNQRVTRQVPINKADRLYGELCPWLGCPPTEYFDDYMASREPVLILLGPTGTGKTSFIRSLIWHKTLHTKITYDERLLDSDIMFFDFLIDPSIDMLVVEDADVLLRSRDSAANKVMARFLNVTNGLIGVTHKKIIFTANIMEPSEIDEALMRDGRCFDCQVFRPLTYDEACIAAHKIGLPTPPQRKDYTIANLFSITKKRRRPPFPVVGFRSR